LKVFVNVIVFAANEACERVASIGLMPNMIIYLTKVYNMETAEATNFLLLWSAATNFTPLIAAFLADSYFGRYRIIAFGSVASLLVYIGSDFLGTLTISKKKEEKIKVVLIDMTINYHISLITLL
jgi:dipeptide/tripeptide permease